MEKDFAEMEGIRVELAEYFCEDTNTFKLEECLKTFNTFCQKFKKAIQVMCLISVFLLLSYDICCLACYIYF